MTTIHVLPPLSPISPASGGQQSTPVTPEVRQETAPPADTSRPEHQQANTNPHDKIAKLMEARLSTLMGMDIRLSLEHNEEADTYVYKAVNRVTGEVVRQYPSEEMLKLMSYYHQKEGLSVNSRV